MSHARNIVLIALFGGFLVASLAHMAADAFVPGYFAPRQSELEGAVIAEPVGLLETSFSEKTLQEATEDLMSDWVPARENLMLLSKGLERQSIATAAAAFGYDVFPTFYSSGFLEDTRTKRLIEMPAAPRASTKRQRQLTRALNAAAKKYPDVRFSVDFVLQPSQSATNPAFELMGGDGLIDEQWVQKTCVDPLDEGIDAFVDTVDTSRTASDTFTTDHHWTLERALDSYNRIAATLGLEPASWDDGRTVTVSDKWYGNYARKGLDTDYPSTLIDQDADFSGLTFRTISTLEEQGAERSGLREGYLAAGTGEPIEHGRFESLYMDYYGETNSYIDNAGPNNGKTCLLVGDSFSLCLKRYIAANYERTINLLPGNETVHKRLSKYIKDYDVDDVIVIMHPEKSRLIANFSPKFMKVGT